MDCSNPLKVQTYPQFTYNFKQVYETIYSVVSALFRATFMAIQYLCLKPEGYLREWLYFPTPLPKKFIVAPSHNIADLKHIGKCLYTALFPIPKEEFSSFGKAEGLCVTDDIIYQANEGLCLGTSLCFLSKYFETGNFETAAQQDETCLKVQALYNVHFRKPEEDAKYASHDALHLEIMRAVAQTLKLNFTQNQRMNGTISDICKELFVQPDGAYLLQFQNHTVACVKSKCQWVIMESRQGLAKFSNDQQEETFNQLLNFYGSNQYVSLKVIQVIKA